MQQPVFECMWANKRVCFSISAGFVYHEGSAHVLLIPHDKCCAVTSNLSQARHFPWHCIALQGHISLDLEAA